MNNSLTDMIKDRLSELDPSCDYESFQGIVTKLVNQQSLWGAEHMDKKEQNMFFMAERVYDLLVEVLNLLGCKIYLNTSWQLMYLLPGSSTHALFEGDVHETEENFTFKRLTKAEISLLITFRYIYQQAINTGELDGSRANTTIGDINHAHYNLFGEYIPESQQARNALLKTLKRMRIIDYKELGTGEDVMLINVLVLLYDLSNINKMAAKKVDEIESIKAEVNNEA
jgi:hypothetical protein